MRLVYWVVRWFCGGEECVVDGCHRIAVGATCTHHEIDHLGAVHKVKP